MDFEFIAYDPDKTPADMSVFRDNVKTQTVSVPRTVQIYTNRYTSQGKTNMRFECGTTLYPFYIDVKASSIDIEEITAGQVLKLSAAGRSNTEENPAQWEYNGIKTTFNGFDWSGSGWTGETLKMQNGANIEIGYKPFASDATPNGATYEFELRCSNITNKKGVILSCMEGGIGFQMTAEEVKMIASNGSSVNTPFVPDMNFHISFVIQKENGHKAYGVVRERCAMRHEAVCRNGEPFAAQPGEHHRKFGGGRCRYAFNSYLRKAPDR